jgi:hypothetical protein
MGSTSKIFSLVLVFVLMASCASAVKVIKPGDVVKGKVVKETFYAYTESEQSELLKKLDVASLAMQLAESRAKEIEILKEKVKLHESNFAVMASQTTFFKVSLDASHAREMQTFEIMNKELAAADAKLQRARRRYLSGALTAIAALLGGRALVVAR